MNEVQERVKNLRHFESIVLQRICSLSLAGAAAWAAQTRQKGCEISLRRVEDDRRMKMIAHSELVRPLANFCEERVWLMGKPRNYKGRAGLFTLLAHAGDVHQATTWPCSWASFDAGWRAVHRGARRITSQDWVAESGPRTLRSKASQLLNRGQSGTSAADLTLHDMAKHLQERAKSMELPWEARAVCAPLFDSFWLIATDEPRTADATSGGSRNWTQAPPFALSDIPVRSRRRQHSVSQASPDVPNDLPPPKTFTASAAIVQAELWPWTRDSAGVWGLFAAAKYVKRVWQEAGWDITLGVGHQRW
jgi:hypothetical protein